MKFRDVVGLIYGVFMGTSTIYVKSARTYEFPYRKQKIGSIELLTGGKRNQIFGNNFSVDSEPENKKGVAISTRAPTDLKVEGLTIKPISTKNLVVWIPSDKMLALGDLFYNRVHPPLRDLDMPPVAIWTEILKGLREEFRPSIFVPAEGDGAEDISEFVNYLTDLADRSLEFEALKKKYGHFAEIVGSSSFSENFDYLRS